VTSKGPSAGKRPRVGGRRGREREKGERQKRERGRKEGKDAFGK